MPSFALRIALGATVLFACAVLATVEFASSAMASRFLPHRGISPLSLSTATRVERLFVRVSPVSFMLEDLASDALVTGHLNDAQRYASLLGATPARNELLMRIAVARHEPKLASEYALAAPDPAAITKYAQEMMRRSPIASYDYVGASIARFESIGAHPDAVALQNWERGRIAASIAERKGGAKRRYWMGRALASYATASQLAPYSQTYLLSAGTQAWLDKRPQLAQHYYLRALAIDPHSVDALAGLGVVAVALGHRVEAQSYLRRARNIDANASFVRTLEHALH